MASAVLNEKSAALVPLITGIGRVSVAVPRFTTVIVMAFDFVSVTVPKPSVEAGLSRTGVVPVPVSATTCGLVGSLLTVMVIVALSAVSPLGVKLTGITQAVLPAQERTGVTAKSAPLGPEMASLSVSGNGDALVTFKKVKVRVDDCTRLPNAIVVIGSVSGIVGPVVSATV